MEEKTKYIRKLVMSQQRMLDELGKCDLNVQIYPGWQTEELLAHLIGWDELLIDLVHQVKEYGTNVGIHISTIDEYNTESVQKRKNITLKQTLNDYVSVRLRLLGEFETLSATEIEQELEMPWGEKGRLIDVIKIWSDHEEEHLEDVQRIVKGNK